jgi:UDP-N-acetylmuramoylalanine--D-glutamate ligase
VRFSDLEGAAIGVWGAGRETAAFATQVGRRLPRARIVAAAFDTPPDAAALARLQAPAARVGFGPDAASVLTGCDVLVRSPGVSIHRRDLAELRAGGLPTTTATALWLAERGGAGVIGVTGTKGKSTTAALACHLARAAGRPARLAGNIGRPAIELLDGEPGDPDVVELSSYQTADMETGPEVAVVTNIFREHVDWHGSEATYRSDKLRVLSLSGVRKRVLNGNDPVLAGLARRDDIPFGIEAGWSGGADGLHLRGELVAPLAALPLPGAHNALNLAAALAALDAYGVEVPAPSDALGGFRPLPHRLQAVVCDRGVTWIDDSISTTPESALAALASYPEAEVILIAGGQDRGQDNTELAAELARRGGTVIGVPSTGSELVSAVRAAGVPEASALVARSLDEAVALAGSLATAGTVVLLSPAAPSYDHYRDFEERGELFAALAAERARLA